MGSTTAPAPSAAAIAAGFTPYVPPAASNSAQPVNSSTSEAPSNLPEGFTPYNPDMPVTAKAAPVAAPVPQKPSVNDIGSGMMKALGDAFHQVASQFSQGVSQAAEGENELGIGTPAKASGPIEGLESGLKTESGIATAALSPLAPLMNPIANLINTGIKKVTDIPAVQKVATSLPDLPYNRLATDTGNISNIAGAISMVKAPEVAKTLAENAPEIGSGPFGAPTLTPEEIAAERSAKTAANTKSLATEWTKPSEEKTASYNKTRAVLQQDSSIPQFLAEQGLDPRAHIEDGKYNTTETADALRETAAKLSSETLRPSLQMADYTTPRTPVEDLIQPAIRNVSRDPTVTAGDKETIIDNINKEASALQKQYPNGMSLTDMHDNKITYAKNGGYSPYRSASDSNIATANRSLGLALGKMVEDKAPTDVPVKEFNGYLSKYYKAADYLDTLTNKKAPVSMGQQIARGVARFGGAALARTVFPFGGELVSSFAGYQIGKAIEHGLENLSSSARAHFMNNLQFTNPEAFTKVQEYLKNASSGNTGIPRLNAGGAIQMPQGEIGGEPVKPIMGESGVKMLPAAKGLPNVNKATGKFQSTYKSVPK